LHHQASGAGPRVVLVHGFTQTLASWSPLTGRLGTHRELVACDLPGHGGSTALRLGMDETVAALAEVGGRAAYVGYSMGGRVCLRLALDRPDLVAALALVGASPGLADPAERARRQADDEALAATIERDGVGRFLDRWLAQPLFATLQKGAAGLEARLANRPDGLAAALRLLGTGAQPSVWERLPELHAPILLIAGALDTKFAAIAEDMAARIAGPASVALVEGAGHAAHLERPAAVARLLDEFLSAHAT
jgi:2-succinyl-6-hydroxy-2,4-cyclohexadiene-1-carboxylate synthase